MYIDQSINQSNLFATQIETKLLWSRFINLLVLHMKLIDGCCVAVQVMLRLMPSWVLKFYFSVTHQSVYSLFDMIREHAVAEVIFRCGSYTLCLKKSSHLWTLCNFVKS